MLKRIIGLPIKSLRIAAGNLKAVHTFCRLLGGCEMVFNGRMLLLYAISGRDPRNKMMLHEQVERALEGGITMFQLREKALADCCRKPKGCPYVL